jgi:hypothetical protein
LNISGVVGAAIALLPDVRISTIAAATRLDCKVKRDIVVFVFRAIETSRTKHTAIVE